MRENVYTTKDLPFPSGWRNFLLDRLVTILEEFNRPVRVAEVARKFYSDRPTTRQKEDMRHALKMLIGFEVVERAGERRQTTYSLKAGYTKDAYKDNGVTHYPALKATVTDAPDRPRLTPAMIDHVLAHSDQERGIWLV